MKKGMFAIFGCMTLIFLLTSCDVTTLLNTFKGNIYEEVFNVNLVEEQVEETLSFIKETGKPIERSREEVVDNENNFIFDDENIPPDVIMPKLAVKSYETIPLTLSANHLVLIKNKLITLPSQSALQKRKLTKYLNSTLTGNSIEAFEKALQQQIDETEKIAIYNTVLIDQNRLDAITNSFSCLSTSSKSVVPVNTSKGIDYASNNSPQAPPLASGMEIGAMFDLGIVRSATGFVDNFLPDLSGQPPTNGDSCGVYLANNLVQSFINFIVVATKGGEISSLRVGAADLNNMEISQYFMEVVDDLNLLYDYTKKIDEPCDLIDKIDITNLLNNDILSMGTTLESKALISKSKTLKNSTLNLSSDTVQLLNTFKSTTDLVVDDILGVNKNEVTLQVDEETFNSSINYYTIQKSLFNVFLLLNELCILDSSDIKTYGLENFVGVSGFINYTLSSILTTAPELFSAVQASVNDSEYPDYISIINAFLNSNKNLVRAKNYDESMVFTIPDNLDNFFDSFGDIKGLITTYGLEDEAKNYLDNVIVLASLGQSGDNSNLLIDALNNTIEKFDN